MSQLTRSLLLAIPLLLLHCGGRVEVNSLPRKGWSKPIDRVFLLCTAGPSGSSYRANDLQERLARALAARQVATRSWMSNILDLADADKLKAELSGFKPHYLLRISQIAATYTNGTQTAATFDLLLTETGVEEPVWKARASLSGNWGGGDPEKLSQAILEAMRQDGVLLPS